MAEISFDYDGTTDDHFFGEENKFKEKIQKLITTLIYDGHNVHIVTRRYGPEIEATESVKVYATAEKLGVLYENVHFTNREWKFTKLNQLRIQYHIDDDEMDIFNINLYCANVKGVLLESEDSISEFYNLCNENREE